MSIRKEITHAKRGDMTICGRPVARNTKTSDIFTCALCEMKLNKERGREYRFSGRNRASVRKEIKVSTNQKDSN